MRDPIQKIPKGKKARVMTQVIENLPYKYKALSSNSTTIKKEKKIEIMIINSGRNLSRLYSLQQLPDGNSGNYQYSVKNKHLNYPEFSVCHGRIMTTHCYFSPSIAKTYSWKILGPTTLLLPFCH
jgi:hypothetical protein